MNYNQQMACKDAVLMPDSSSSAISFQLNIASKCPPCPPLPPPEPNDLSKPTDLEVDCDDVPITSTSSTSGLSDDIINRECRGRAAMRKVPDVSYELCLAKSILQQYSTISGDNL